MKKKVLFALIAMFSFLTTWAQGIYVTVSAGGGYTAQLHQTETYVFAGEGLPTVDKISIAGEPVSGTISPALDGTYKVVKKVGGDIVPVESVNGEFNPLTVGNYYLEFTITGTETVKTVYVPFQVGQEFNGYEFIWNETTFNNSCTDGALRMYYDTYYPGGCDEDGHWDVVASVEDGKYTGHEGFPWIAFKVPATLAGSYKVMFTYDNEEGLTGLNNPCMPWYEKDIQTFGNGTNDRKFGLASVVERTSFNHFDWQIGYDPNAANTFVGPNPNPDGPEDDAFKISEFHMYWMPAEAITDLVIDPESTQITDISEWTWSLPTITFNGAEQKLDAFFTSGAAKVVEDASQLATALTFGTDFTATYTGTDYTNAGEGKSVTITGIGKYKGSFTKTYTINPFVLDNSNFKLNPEGPTFQYDGTNKAPAVEGTGVTPPATTDVPNPTAVALTASDFTTKLYKSTETTPEEKTSAVEAGSYYYVVTPKGNYTVDVVDNEPVTIVLEFTVQGLDLSNTAVVTMPEVTQGELTIPGYVYNTKVQQPTFTATQDKAVDATVTYKKNAGLENEETVTLTEGKDFTVAYSNSVDADYKNVGNDKQFTINFKGSYTGSKVVTYSIFAKDIDEIDTKNFSAPTYNPEGGAQVTADNFDFKYNTVALEMGDATNGKDFTWAWKDGSDGETAGPQTIVVTGHGNYEGTTEVGFNLKPFTVTITPAVTTKVYGEPDPAPNFTIDSNSASKIKYGSEEWEYIKSFLVMERNINDDNNSDALRETVVEGGHKYSIKEIDPNAACNYQIIIQNNDAILFIYPAPLTVHVANNSKTYSGDPATDPNFIADKDNDNKFSITNAAGQDVTNAKDYADVLQGKEIQRNLKEVLNISRKPGEDVVYNGDLLSGYDFTWDNPNYDVTFNPGKFIINPKTVSISVAFDGNGYEYKGADWNPMPSVVISGTETALNSPKDFSVSYEPGTGLNDLINVTEGNNIPNNRWPSGTVTANPKGNYKFNPVQAYFKITQAELNISAISDNKKAYTGITGTDPTPLAKLSFAPNKGPKGRDTYNAETGEFNFTFTKPLIIREEGEHTGDYWIRINPEAKTRNYRIVSTAADANFLIYRTDEVVISFDPNPKNITYDDALDLRDLVKIDAPTGLNTADLLAYAKEHVKKYQFLDPETGEVDNEGVKTYVETNNVGTYHLTIDDVPTAYRNYDVRLVEGVLNIDYLPLYIIANDSKEYGDEEPTTYDWDVYEYKKVGNVYKYVKTERTDFEVPEADLIGNTGNWMTDAYRYTISRERGENVGHYATTIRNYRSVPFSWIGKEYGTQYDGNYSFTFEQGDFEITRRALTVAVEGASKFYGEFDPKMEDGVWVLSKDLDENEEDEVSVFTKGLVKITVTNALPQDVRAIADKVTFTHRDAGEVVKAGGYQVKNVNFDGVNLPGATRLPNYTLSYSNNAYFMINKRVLKVTAHDQSVEYANPLVLEPYDMTITEGILLEDVYTAGNPKGEKYFDPVTTMAQGEATDHKAINDRVDKVFKPLEKADDCPTNVGVYHKNAFKLELTEFGDQNYVLEFTNGKLYIEDAPVLYLDMKDLAQALNDHIGRTVEVRLCGAPVKEDGCDPFREFVAYNWNTFVLPFSELPRNISAAFRYGVIDILNEENDVENQFSLAVTTRRIPANTPFVIQTDKSWTYGAANNDSKPTAITFGQQTIADFDYLNEDPTAIDAAGNKFIGTYGPKSEFDASDYIMKLNAQRRSTGDFFRFVPSAADPNPSYAMVQTEAYLEAANAAGGPARILIDEEDGTATVIEFVGAEGVATSTSYGEGWYTVNGVKLDAEPTTTGTYIYNGKKVYIQR